MSRNSLQDEEGLTDPQEMLLAILPIPSAILSIFGSSLILFIAKKSREKRRWTPYTRLLLGLSIFDIFSSATMAVSTFLRPNDSHRIWSFGNDTTCSIIGFLTQATHSSACYNVMLSFYFLLTARFGLKNDYIATWIEPLMHFISIGYFLGTASVGAALGVYADTSVGPGCWVNDYPRNCGHGPGRTGEDCLATRIGWIFYGYPVCPLRQNKIVSGNTHNEDRDRASEGRFESDEFGRYPVGDTSRNTQGWSDSSTSKQLRRLRMVQSQAFLFVANYILVSIWLGLMAVLENQKGGHNETDELSVAARIYPIMVLNAIFMPLQGFLNLLVYMRPKYLKWRDEYPDETRMWVIRRSIHGEKVRPTKVPGKNGNDNEESNQDVEAHATAVCLPLARVSTLTLSEGDVDHIAGEEERWAGSGRTETAIPWMPSRRSTSISSRLNHRISSLEVICETSASAFEYVVQDGFDSTERNELQKNSLKDFDPPADRWSPFSGCVYVNQDTALAAPRPTDSENEEVPLSGAGSSYRTLVGSSNVNLNPSKKKCRWALLTKDHTTPIEMTMPQRLASGADDTEISFESGSSMNSVGSLWKGSFLAPALSYCGSRWNSCYSRHESQRRLEMPQRRLEMPQRVEGVSEAQDRASSLWTCMFGTSDEPIRAPRRSISPSPQTARRPVWQWQAYSLEFFTPTTARCIVKPREQAIQ
eukprot:scaffold2799_cov117-Cylindrotheca_fusiformis.AAC.4